MAKKPANDETSEHVDIQWPVKEGDIRDELTFRAAMRLIESKVVTYDDHSVTWRTGHLEHIANLFAGDPATTERDYADDLAVARAYSREQWEALIAPPQA